MKCPHRWHNTHNEWTLAINSSFICCVAMYWSHSLCICMRVCWCDCSHFSFGCFFFVISIAVLIVQFFMWKLNFVMSLCVIQLIENECGETDLSVWRDIWKQAHQQQVSERGFHYSYNIFDTWNEVRNNSMNKIKPKKKQCHTQYSTKNG